MAKATGGASSTEAKKSPSVKKSSGVSRGGALSKKEREVTSMGGDLMSGKDSKTVWHSLIYRFHV